MLGRETKLGARLECLAGFSGRAGACNETDPARDSKWRFYPLNYGNNDLQRINGLNCNGEERRCDAQRFLERDFRARLLEGYLRVSLRRAFPCESKWPLRLKKRSSWKSRMCCSQT